MSPYFIDFIGFSYRDPCDAYLTDSANPSILIDMPIKLHWFPPTNEQGAATILNQSENDQ